MATSKTTGTSRKTSSTSRAATASRSRAAAASTAAPASVPEPVMDMTHSDSMPIVTPKSRGRIRRPIQDASIPVLEEVSPQGKRRRRGALIVLILALMLFGFWLGRVSYRAPAAPVDLQPPVPAHVALPPSAPTTPAPAARTEPPKAAATVASAATAPAATVASAPAEAEAPATHLLEVSVGTSVRGGLTMKFDHPVNWSVLGNDGQGSAEVDVLGVRDLGTFPRNLPLPPGVKVIHAGILEPDTLRLRFTLSPDVRAFTAPTDGPAPALNIFFRTAAEGAALPMLPQTVQGSGGCGSAPVSHVSKAAALLQASLDKNPSYADVRTALAILASCGGDGARAEQLLSEGLKSGGNPGLQWLAADAALRFARGDADGALTLLKSNAAAAKGDAGFAQLIADLQSAAR